MPNKPTILITGGAGFVGSHLTDRYISKGYRVICLDNLSTGSMANVEHLSGDSSFTFVEHDICKPMPESISSTKIKAIANLASPASPPHYQRLAIETLLVGSVGTINMLELAKKTGARFIQASTSEVYGDPEVHPQPENYKGSVNSYGPRSMYDEAKRFSEAAIYVYRNKESVNTGIARFFNTYGPRMDPNDGRVVSNFIVQALKGQNLTVYGKGNQTRSFCYIDDLINGLEKLIDSSLEGPVNLGNPGEFTILELAEKILEKIKTNSKITYEPLPGDDPTQRKPVIKMAKKELGWEPKIDLSEGLDRTIDYFRNSLGI